MDAVDSTRTVDLVVIGVRHRVVVAPEEDDCLVIAGAIGAILASHSVIERINYAGRAGCGPAAVVMQREVRDDEDRLVVSDAVQVRSERRNLVGIVRAAALRSKAINSVVVALFALFANLELLLRGIGARSTVVSRAMLMVARGVNAFYVSAGQLCHIRCGIRPIVRCACTGVCHVAAEGHGFYILAVLARHCVEPSAKAICGGVVGHVVRVRRERQHGVIA